MGKEIQTRTGFDFDLEVVETKALWERWKGIALTWRSATVDLGRRLWAAHKALGADPKGGRPKTVSGKGKTVSSETVSDFIDKVGIPKATFYRFIERIDEMIAEGVDVMALPSDMKLVEAAAPKSQQEVELEELLAEKEEEIKGRDKAIAGFEESIKHEHALGKAAAEEIAGLKAKLEGTENPVLQQRIVALEKKEVKLAEKINWLDTAMTFKKRLQTFLGKTSEISELADALLKAVPKTPAKPKAATKKS